MTVFRRRSAGLFLTGALSLTLVACGDATGTATGVERDPTSVPMLSMDRDPYESVGQLVRDSIAVVRGTAQKSEFVPDGSYESTLTTLVIDKQFKGRRLPDSIVVRQPGTPEYILSGSAPVLTQGQRYVLFLGAPTGLDDSDLQTAYTVVGNAGSFLFESDNRLRRQDPESPKLPAELTVEQLVEQVGK